jgi:antitoxin (DNA-binding transcriptional repressor) of toxin-antitoxin stability system
MVVMTEIGTGQLADLVKQVQAGNEVLLTQGDKPVARLVPAREASAGSASPLNVRSLKGHRVLTPILSQEELADDLFDRQ